MSHSTTRRSHLPPDRFSWSSLPDNQNMRDTALIPQQTQNEQRLLSPSPVSTPVSENLDDRQIASGDAAPLQFANEDSRLLSADQDVACQPSNPSPTDVIPDENKESAYKILLSQTATTNSSNKDLSDAKTLVPATWLPYTLRRSFLVLFGLLSLALSTVLAVLCWYSAHHRGLGKDDGSARLLVGWRYTPTIIAVMFTQALVVMAEDVKRTEAFARMAHPIPVEAKYTLLYTPKVWWKSLCEGASRKRCGGRRSWLLTFSSLAAGLSILVISTFSSSVFTVRDVLFKDAVRLQRYASGNIGAITLQPRRTTYSRTISGFLYNTSTSIWVSDNHVIFPFAPGSTNGVSESFRDGTWEAETKVLQLDSVCVPAPMIEKKIIEVAFSYTGDGSCNNSCTHGSRGFKVRSGDGCEVQVQSPITIDTEHDRGLYFDTTVGGFLEDRFTKGGGAYWTNMSSSYVSWQDIVREKGRTPRLGTFGDGALTPWSRTFIYDLSDECRGRDLLLVTPPWSTMINSLQEKYWENFTARAEVCTPTIYEANLSVTVSMHGAGTPASFDEADFMRRRKPLSVESLDGNRLNNLTFGEAWQKYMTARNGIRIGPDGSDVYTEGVSLLLSTAFQNRTDMLSNSTVAAQASRLRARFFHELLLSSIAEADVPAMEDVAGYNTLTERRIVVVQEIAITLSVLFFLAACYLLITIWGASTARRPLHLRTDPTTIIGTTSLIELQSSLASRLRSWHASDRRNGMDDLGSRPYTWQNNSIVESTLSKGTISPLNIGNSGGTKRTWLKRKVSIRRYSSDWRPHMLHKRWLITLLFALAAVAIAILVLRGYAIEQKLYRTAFVYQVDLGLFQTSFSPHSVIATLIAVAIGLSWDGIDKPLRALQPCLEMSRNSSNASRTVSLTYQPSFWAWAAVKAALHRHWILCLVATGTTLSQILIISMAAVFERQAVIQTQSTQDITEHMNQTLTLRQEPFSFSYSQSSRPWNLEDGLLFTSQADWIYKALDEITLGSPTPPWTRDEWVFTPVNMEELPNAAVPQDHNAAEMITSSVTVSLNTSALRSRMECSTISVPSSGWLDHAEDVFSNRTRESIKGYVLPPLLFKGTPFSTPIFTAPRRMACCTNGTVRGRQSVIAYWSSNSSLIEKQPEQPLPPNGTASLKVPRAWFSNFTVKWIVGPTSSTIISGADPPETHIDISQSWGYANESLLYFTEQPEMAILNCIPIIEQANASVIVARSSGHILDAKIISEPRHTPEAWEYAYDLEYLRPPCNSTTSESGYDADGHFWSTVKLHPECFQTQGNVR